MEIFISHFNYRIELEMSSKQSLKFSLRILKILSLLGYNFTTIVDGKSVTTFSNILRFIGSLIAGILYVTLAIIHKDSMMNSGSPIASLGNYATFLTSVLIVMVSQTITFIFRHNIWKISRSLAKIEDEVNISYIIFSFSIKIIFIQFEKVNKRVNYLDQYRSGLFKLFAVNFLMIPLITLNYYYEGNFLKSFFNSYALFFFLINFTVPSAHMFGVQYRLETLLRILNRKFRLNQEFQKRKDDSEFYEILSSIYSQIIDCCRLVSKTYGIQLMLCYGLTFFYSLFITFTVYADYSNFGYVSKITQSSLSFCVYCNGFVIGVIFLAEKLNKNANAINSTLKNLLKRETDELNSSMILSFGLLVQRRMPKITCGFFDFTWTLIFSMISSGATNLIILIQFDIAARHKSNS
jgi:hypothetical protein